MVDDTDTKDVRRLKHFKTKRAAKDWAAGTHIEIKQGAHVADTDSITVGQAGELWLKACRARDGDERLERSTIEASCTSIPSLAA